MEMLQNILQPFLDSFFVIIEIVFIVFPFLSKISWLKNLYELLKSKQLNSPSVLSPFTDVKDRIEPKTVTFFDCIPHLDQLLLDLSWYECRELFALFGNNYSHLMVRISDQTLKLFRCQVRLEFEIKILPP